MYVWLRRVLQRVFGRRHSEGLSSPVPRQRLVGAARWVEADDPANPFGVRIIDCSSTAAGLISFSKNPNAARSYGRLRSDDGRRHIGKIPPDQIIATCDLNYPIVEPTNDGPLHTSREMEDKWDVYLHEKCLYFSRSWLGELDYLAYVDFLPNRMLVHRISARAGRAFGDATMAVRQADFLIKSLLLGWRVPAPLPPDHRIDDTKFVAVYLFNTYGRHAAAGTYEDSLLITP